MVKAILTSDVIHSTKMSVGHRNWMFKQITDALKQWNKDFNMKSETFRGDSFQALLKQPVDALKMALIQKTFIRSLNPDDLYKVRKKDHSLIRRGATNPFWIFDARIAIGIGNIDTLTNRLASSGGKAFQLSGQLLDKMKSRKQTLAIATDDMFNDELETEIMLLDAIISKTSALQCEVINLKLLGYTETEIGERLEIKQSAVNQRSNSGNWNAIDTMLKRFENIYS